VTRIGALYDSRFLRHYVDSKVRTDPVYSAVAERLRGHARPIIDVGCGAGVLEFFLREAGIDTPIVGVDCDASKIDAAKKASRYRDLEFVVGDARADLPCDHSVVLLDVLHYFDQRDRAWILANASRADLVIIRDTVRDGSWRYRATRIAELFATGIGWLKAERLEFPTRDEIVAAFDGFEVEIVPMWGRTQFNNYLFVFRRSSPGTVNS
jgi:SAM-dependent methyltransferase